MGVWCVWGCGRVVGCWDGYLMCGGVEEWCDVCVICVGLWRVVGWVCERVVEWYDGCVVCVEGW